MDELVSRAVARPRMTAVLMVSFAAIAAALAGVGLYGVLSYAVSQRVREIGVRMALGAEPRAVLGRVVGEGMSLVLAGLFVGVGAALLASRFLASILYGIEPTDAVAMGGACLFLTAVALSACALPAWRATRVDPAVALRSE
jgi:ABC-type antimicrobial peptide transport system permease subunit